jgi:D-alanyl-lipoteichoic acid acyltransferase DltB (MBOAT superfamily)
LYIPLGGNRKGAFRRYLNLMLTMLLGGLWHGANYTFVLWGALHGIYLMINHAWRALRSRSGNSDATPAIRVASGRLASRFATFLCVSVAWVFFRSADLGAARNMLRGMLGMSGLTVQAHAGAARALLTQSSPQLAAVFLAAGILVWAMPNTRQIADRLERALDDPAPNPLYLRIVPATAGVVLALAVLEMRQVSTFLYFQF